MVVHRWVCGDSLVGRWRLMGDYSMCGDLLDMWWFTCGYVVVHLWICGGSFVDMCELIVGYV